MTIRSFNSDWTVGPKTSIYEKLQGASGTRTPVTLPHDAQFSLQRSADKGEGPHVGFFPSASFEYTKHFEAPDEFRDKRVSVEFQAAYRDAVVFVNDVFAAQRPNGYSGFVVDLDPYLKYGSTNTVRVELRAHEDSRWYSGVGLIRDTRLFVLDLLHLVPNSDRVQSTEVDEASAIVIASADVRNSSTVTRSTHMICEVRDAAGHVVAADRVPVTLEPGGQANVCARMLIDEPKLWDADSPTLYTATLRLSTDAPDDDAVVATFGIRTLQLDVKRGLRINGKAVKLRGACIHHDNGLLGGAAIAGAEERRVRILKAAGFNAIRSAHNPLSVAMLDACDRLGMFVMDETFDVWTVSKSSFDYSLAFPEWWERDVESMVQKDFNHPSVIMYSIGNENPETGGGLASAWSRRLAQKIRSLDGSRYVTNGVNGFVAAIDDVAAIMQAHVEAASVSADQGVNDAMNMGDFMNHVSASAQVTARTEEAFSVLDVAGMNYGDSRYLQDRELFPNRVIVGTETFPSHIDTNWRLVEDLPHVIGDFTWTGWDYLGEAGAGRITYLEEGQGMPSFQAGYPWLTAWTGDIDITGHRRPISYYRETVFGLRHEPYIAVQRPETFGRPAFAGQWSWSDTVCGWSWEAAHGARTSVEVYSDAEEVELLLNGVAVGRQPAGAANSFIAKFEVAVESGTLTAVAYTQGVETGTATVASPVGALRLHAVPERNRLLANDAELAYIPVEIRDASGNLANDADVAITATLNGPGEILAVGSARPDPTERFDTGTHAVFDGRAMVIVRPTQPGHISVLISAPGFEDVAVQLQVSATDGS